MAQELRDPNGQLGGKSGLIRVTGLAQSASVEQG